VISKYASSNLKRYKASNSALVAIDPASGEVLALVGSNNYFDIENEGNFNVAIAKRQPGSAFKPFAYATALNKGYPDHSIIFDLKTEFNPNCSPDGSEEKDEFGLDCYHPRNYDNRFRGPVTFRQGLAQSLNLPSVKVLYLAGIGDTISLAEKMGITTLKDRSRFGLSLVLGGAEVKLVDLVSAYGVFANNGIRNQWFIIKKVESSNGSILEEKKENPVRIVGPQIANLINNILSDNSSRAPVFGYSNNLNILGRQIAAKTGTTQENRDAWTVGYSPSLVAGVWAGNNNNNPMTDKGAGVNVAGPIWKEFMVRALKSLPNEKFTNPDPVVVDKIMLDGNYIYKKDEESDPEIHEILYYIDRDNPLGSIPRDPSKDPQFENWEWSVRNFYPAP